MTSTPFFLPNPSCVRATCQVDFLDGDPAGVRMATSPGSSAVVLCAPWSSRSVLADGIQGLTIAAYFMAGPLDLEGIAWQAYVGETIQLPERLDRHARDPAKNFVTTVYAISSRDPAFGKSHVQGLQWLLDARFEQVGRAHVLRGQRPSQPDLDPEIWAMLELMLDDACRGLCALGCRLLEPVRPLATKPVAAESRPAAAADTVPVNEATTQPDPGMAHTAHDVGDDPAEAMLAGPTEPQQLMLEHRGLWAHASAVDGAVTVKAGSEVRKTAYISISEGISRARKTLQEAGAFVEGPDGDRWRLIRDVVVPSRTYAARLVSGSHLDGKAWRPLP